MDDASFKREQDMLRGMVKVLYEYNILSVSKRDQLMQNIDMMSR